MNVFDVIWRNGIAILAVFLPACAATSISASHDPLYRAEPHFSTITAVANNSRDGISMIRIHVIVGEMTTCTFTIPSRVPCRTGAATQTRTCVLANPRTGSCTITQRLEDRRLVTYSAEAFSRGGSSARTLPITYAGGASIFFAPFGVRLVSWDVARPIWWHTDSPPRDAFENYIDMGFYPDRDWPTYRAFTDALQPLLLAAHFDRATPSSRFYSVFRDSMFNLWAGPEGADAEEGCNRSFGGQAAGVSAVTDGELIFHRIAFRDCASISLEGAGSTDVGPRAGPTYVHETGHFIMGLGDEYCCDGGYASQSDPPNIFSSQQACIGTATALGLPTSWCVEIRNAVEQTGFWRMDDGQPSIMEDEGAPADWRTASGRALANRLRDCLNGNC